MDAPHACPKYVFRLRGVSSAIQIPGTSGWFLIVELGRPAGKRRREIRCDDHLGRRKKESRLFRLNDRRFANRLVVGLIGTS